MIDDKPGVEYKYLIVNEQDKQFGLLVNTVGFQCIHPKSSYPLSDHPEEYFFEASKGRILEEYQLVYITSGIGYFKNSSTDFISVTKGQVMLLFPGEWHSYYPDENVGWNEYYIGFCGGVIDNIVENSFLSKDNPILDVGLNEELVSLFKRAIEIAKIDKTATQQNLLGIVMHMIGLIISQSQCNKLEYINCNQIIEVAKIIMKENIFENIYPEELAAKLNMNYTTFRKLFKSITGYSPAKYFQALKVQKAKQLLLETSLSVKEISYKLNFYSPESFNTTFKNSTGETPSKYRLICRMTRLK
jgi:AraC-like DNA-binding protein